MNKTLEEQVGQFLIGCKRLVGRGIFVQEQDKHFVLSAGFLLHIVLQLPKQRSVILCFDSMVPWKIINT